MVKAKKKTPTKKTAPAKKGKAKAAAPRKAAKAASSVTAAALAQFVGVPLLPRITDAEERHLLKPYPGFRALVPLLTQLLREDGPTLELDFDPDALDRDAHDWDTLGAATGVLQQVLDGADGQHQRMASTIMKAIDVAGKRVKTRADVHPEIAQRWKPVTDLLDSNRPGHPGSSESPPPGPKAT